MGFIRVPPEPLSEQQWKLTCARYNEWLSTGLFSYRWWMLFGLFCVTAFLLWKLADKVRLVEVALYTSLVVMFIIVLDEVGEELALWYYKVDLLFLFPPITAVDITCMPLVYMLIYQRYRAWKSFLLATAIMSVLFCFVCEPIFVWGGVYGLLTWKSFYGLPLYFAIAVVSKAIVGRVWALSAKKVTG